MDCGLRPRVRAPDVGAFGLVVMAETIARWGLLLDVWVFVLGAIVGSFLNVVIYRLPAGKSLARPGSLCPACGKPIRGRHNVPILGWIMLRGRCYDCRTPISLRYPLVELTAGLLLLALVPVDVRPLLPRVDQPALGHAVDGWSLLASLFFHGWLLCTLLAGALIGWDGGRQPLSLYGCAAAVGIVIVLLAPSVMESGATAGAGLMAARRWTAALPLLDSPSGAALMFALAGGLCGAFAGWVIEIVTRRMKKAATTGERYYAILGVAGLFLGPVMAIASAVAGGVALVIAALAVGRTGAKERTSVTWLVPATTLVMACVWIYARVALPAWTK